MNSFAKSKGRDIMAHDAKIARRVRRKVEIKTPESCYRSDGGESPESLLDLSASAQADDPVEGYVDEVLKPLYDKISELTQENAKLREALRKLREPMRERAVEEAQRP